MVLLHHTQAHKVHKVFFQELHLLEVEEVMVEVVLPLKVVQVVVFLVQDQTLSNLLLA